MKIRDLIPLFFIFQFVGCLSGTGDEKNGGCSKYNRDAFGYGEMDYDNDGCYARAELLISQSLVPVEMNPTSRCRVLRGKWVDAYSDDTLYAADSVEIDHVVALKEAYQSGAHDWAAEKLMSFGNLDTIGEMVIARGSTNTKKSDLDIAEWLPTGEARQKEYAKKWVRIKKTWGLTVDEKEVQAIKAILGENFEGLPNIAPEFNCP